MPQTKKLSFYLKFLIVVSENPVSYWTFLCFYVKSIEEKYCRST